MSEHPNPMDGSFIRVDKEWRSFSENEEKAESRIEGESRYYGCDTGCTYYVVSFIENGEDEGTELFNDYGKKEMITRAAEEADKRGIPLILNQDWL